MFFHKPIPCFFDFTEIAGVGKNLDGDIAISRLSDSQDLSGSTNTKIDLSEFKSIVGGFHVFESFVGVSRFTFGMKECVRLDIGSSHTPTKLMELRKPKAFRVFDNHDGRVGDVYSYFDYGSTY